MRLLRIALPLGALASVVAISAGSAAAGGNAGPPLYPSFVNVQMVQTETLIAKAATYQDEGDTPKAVAALNAARSHMHKAWLAAKFYIDNAPPPVAGDSAAFVVPKAPAKATAKKRVAKPHAKHKTKAKAHSSGGAVPGASPYADQYTTAVGVLTLQHDVAAAVLGIMENADATLLPVVNTTLFAALNDRDTAIAYIHSVDIPPPPASDGSVNGHSSGAPVGSGWATVMPGVLPYVDDELSTVDSLRARLKLSPGRKRMLDDAELQDTKTERTINKYWPPVVGG
jgi:hypothetical protein